MVNFKWCTQPILKENHEATAKIVLDEKADMGVAFDGALDRCFFDEKGGCNL